MHHCTLDFLARKAEERAIGARRKCSWPMRDGAAHVEGSRVALIIPERSITIQLYGAKIYDDDA
jgi:hypothetical protein